MNTKEFLEQAMYLDADIDAKVAELSSLRQLSMRISSSRTDEHVQHSALTEAPFAKWVERIVDKEKEIDEEIDRLVAAKLEISSFIDKVESPEWRGILRSRYMLCQPWKEIADKMGCSLSSIMRKHKIILDKLAIDEIK